METVTHGELAVLKRIQSNLEACILGKTDEILLLLTAMLAGGHVLLEDVPGTGKTVLIKALAKSIHGQFRRIQCNPDLLPTDITGVSIYHPKEEVFLFRPGPIMTHILLADEINRATTKTQSALLEAMEERHITVDGETHELPKPFLLLATQNPIDFEGTYILPEAQLDRFMMKFSMGYPDAETETRMIVSQSVAHPLDSLEPVAEVEQILAIQALVKQVHLDEAVANYLVSVIRLTRENPSIYLGASPRATLALVQAAKAYALLQGRDYVIPDDIKFLAPFVLGHRIILQAEARMEGATVGSVLQSVFQQVKVPVRLER
ncbi:AAA family ATPase [Paenibacillus mucilaginosus]|uniref:Magnesium chelatase n=2 Tax=Paenibacillus mucilaginosus TaxID=61624 RepID=I0BQI3_9BACL|nr:MoxR family ATPase [Paenibacillus mucilaginosus]AEI42724.1 YeaC2 [Paenibacillus mucilaginosus KNP414]AFH64630.1 magnesium chelatase [Paenibacillus mucilaginosus K02]MCG7217033.1 MoxR family ATPase [Paenibacillus mucilaginosus]WDM26103.1 MoxR family ATPase [Paenibacillus mucilaginosus]